MIQQTTVQFWDLPASFKWRCTWFLSGRQFQTLFVQVTQIFAHKKHELKNNDKKLKLKPTQSCSVRRKRFEISQKIEYSITGNAAIREFVVSFALNFRNAR